MNTKAIIVTVALSDLLHDDAANARRSKRPESLAELKASIKAHGLLQSLRVRPKGKKYLVIAGNRRLEAMNALVADGDMSPDEPVPVIVRKEDDKKAHELSTAENIEREPLAPVDEFKAFKRLHDDGSNAEDIAARFGIPARRVHQRLRLAALHPDVLQALADETITLEAAQAFAISPDQERQRKYLEDHKEDRWYLGNAGHIRHAMTQKDMPAGSAVAKLIGEDAYVAAGGEINRDLFGDRTYWTSPEIIDKLVAEKWADQTAAWLAEGWAWVTCSTEFGGHIWSLPRLHAKPVTLSDEDQAQLDDLDDQMAQINDEVDDNEGMTEDQSAAYDKLEDEAQALRDKMERAFTAEQKACTGVIYTPDAANILFGVIDQERAPVPDELIPSHLVERVQAQEAKDEDPLAISAAMATALTVTMTQALQAKVATDRRMALDILVATLHARMRVQSGRPPVHVTGSYGRIDHSTTPEQGGDFAEALAWARAQDAEQLLDYLAVLVAECIDVRDTNQDQPSKQHVDALISYVAPDVLPIFDPEAYFVGVKKPVIVAAYREMCGVTLKDAKKGDMVVAAVEKASTTGWLPAQLRTAAYVGPGSADGNEEIGEAA